MSQIATVVFALGILWLFRLDRDSNSRVSPALWIPVAWTFIGASRNVSLWLQAAPAMESPDQYLDGSPLDRLILTALLAGGVAVLLARGRRVGTLLRANAPLVIFFCYCALSVLWSDYPVVAFKRWTKGVGNLVMVLVVLTEVDPFTAVKRFLARCGFLLISLSVLFIKYYPELGRGYDRWVWTPWYVGVTTDKNALGALCLVFGLASVWRFVEALPNRARPRAAGPLVAHGVVVAMTLWLFWKADSATSLGCFLVGAGLVALTGRFGLRPAAVHVFVVAIVAVCLLGVFVSPEAGLIQALGRNATLTGRVQLWEEVVRMTVDPWFGAGFESFWLGERAKSLWEKYWFHPNEAHNGYLEIFLTLGWLGVALLAFVMARGYRDVIGALRRSPELGRLKLAYFVVAVLYNLTEAAFKVMHPVWITFILAILVTPDVTRREDSPSPSPSEVPLAMSGSRRFS